MDREMEQPLQEPPSELSIEGSSHHGSGSQDLVKSESDRIKTFYQTVLSVLSAIFVFIAAALSGYKDMNPLYSTTNHNKAHLSNLLVAEGLFIMMTFLCAVVLMMSQFLVYQRGRPGRGWCWVLIILVGVTGMMLIMANTVLIIVTNRNNMVLSAILAPVLVLVIVSACAGAWMEEQPSSTLSSRYDTAMKGTFDMATIGTAASFALQGAVAFGYLKTPRGNQGKLDPPLDLAICYTTSTISLIVMMVCAMPLTLLPDNMRKVLVTFVERLRYAVLGALALMALVVSVEFLDGFVVLSVCPEAVAAVLYYAVLLSAGESLPDLDYVFRTVAAVGFTLMIGLYAAFLGTDHYSVYLKAAMLLLLMAVLSSLSRLATPFHFHVLDMRGAIRVGIAGVTLAFPAAALLVACPLVLKVFVDHHLNR